MIEEEGAFPSYFWSKEQIRWKNETTAWIQENVDMGKKDQITFILRIEPDLCIPESALPNLRFKLKKEKIVLKIEMTTKLWKELLLGATLFSRQFAKTLMQPFGFKAESFLCAYEKGYHYYSYLWYSVEFEKIENETETEYSSE
jgi:hypothetical protein